MLKITIEAPNADWTPKGKRNAKVVETTGVTGKGRQLRWYVSGKLYRRLAPTMANVSLTREWLEA